MESTDMTTNTDSTNTTPQYTGVDDPKLLDAYRLTLVAGVKTDVHWLKSRLVEISRQLDNLSRPNQRHDN
jgi:hypothetical protein